MTSKMPCLRSAVALALLAGVVAVAPFSSAEARGGPSPSPFEGSYVWGSGTVKISINGQIRGSSDNGFSKASVSGRVSDDGTFAFTVDVTEPNLEHGPRDKRVWIRYSIEYAGVMELDLDGNIVGTTSGGASFVWPVQ